MKLRTRITFLFMAAMILLAAMMMINYINQSIIFQNLEKSLGLLTLAAVPAQHLQDHMTNELALQLAALQTRGQTILKDFENYRYQMYLLMVISAVLVMLLFAIGMSTLKKHVVTRLNSLRRFVLDSHSHGLLHKRLVMSGFDELSQFASLFNSALDAMDKTSSQYAGRLAEIRKIILTLIADMPSPTAYFRMNGDCLGSNMAFSKEKTIMELVRKEINDIQELDSLEALYPLQEDESLRVETIGPSAGVKLLIRASVEKVDASQNTSPRMKIAEIVISDEDE
ncbi:MAG: hypothetical protein OXC44_06040 [Proteobacteria bacterium]|nr:hypothetical protein [Pseudomonadota bacterium]